MTKWRGGALRGYFMKLSPVFYVDDVSASMGGGAPMIASYKTSLARSNPHIGCVGLFDEIILDWSDRNINVVRPDYAEYVLQKQHI
jgi:hypothetical protein